VSILRGISINKRRCRLLHDGESGGVLCSISAFTCCPPMSIWRLIELWAVRWEEGG
jgi:hypothetical protein